MGKIKHKKLIQSVEETANSEAIKNYLVESEKVKPILFNFFNSGFLGTLIESLIFGECRSGNYRDSLFLHSQKPALYAALDLHGENKKANILYVASSYGLGMKLIKEAGYENIKGIDIDKKAVDFCTSQGLDCIVGDAAKTPFSGQSFDMVVSRDFIVFDYAPNSKSLRSQFLDEQYRVLKKGGCAVFTSMLPVEYVGIKYRGMPSQKDIDQSPFKNCKVIRKSLSLKIEEKGIFDFPLWYYQK